VRRDRSRAALPTIVFGLWVPIFFLALFSHFFPRTVPTAASDDVVPTLPRTCVCECVVLCVCVWVSPILCGGNGHAHRNSVYWRGIFKIEDWECGQNRWKTVQEAVILYDSHAPSTRSRGTNNSTNAVS
jgi:hypothetical protein